MERCLRARYGPWVDDTQLRKKRDHELIELLNELRVALPGVQVLFAFLLIAPFSARWEAIGDDQRVAYLVALLATVLGTVLLIAPSAYHRLRWRERNRERMLRTSNRLAIAGMGCVAVAMTASVYLVCAEVLDGVWPTMVTVASGTCFAVAWYVLPLSTPYDRWDDPDDGPGRPEEPGRAVGE